MKRISELILVLLLILTLNVGAQDVLRMHPSSNMYVHNGANMHVFGDFYNNSNLDSLNLITSNSKITFMGDTFYNFSNARTAGIGNVVFLRPRPAPYAATSAQILVGGGNTSSFPTIYINNTNGVNLYNSDSKTRDSVNFVNGHFLLANHNFTVGNSNVGVITNYDENKYFVTNANQTATTGFLVREGLGNTNVDFPVGIATSDYTPARLSNAGTADDYKVRVFPDVYDNATSGTTTQLNELSVQRTWNIQEATNGGSNVTVTLQHNSSTEGTKYSSTNNYISRYWGNTYNTAYLDNSLYSFWDYANFSNSYSNASGNITTGSNIGLMSSRAGITSNFSGNTQYFTKAGYVAPLPIVVLNLKAEWGNNLLTIANVKWQTTMEINNHYFMVERSYDGSNWEQAGKVFSAAPNGNSNTLLDYTFTDSKLKSRNEAAVVYYRLIQFGINLHSETFGPVELYRNNDNGFDVTIYPNPAPNTIYISTPAALGFVKGSVSIKVFDMVGKEVANYITDASYLSNGFAINTLDFADGSYQVQVVKNNFIKTAKILVVKK